MLLSPNGLTDAFMGVANHPLLPASVYSYSLSAMIDITKQRFPAMSDEQVLSTIRNMFESQAAAGSPVVVDDRVETMTMVTEIIRTSERELQNG